MFIHIRILYKVVGFFVCSEGISLAAEPIWFSLTVKLLIGPVMVLGYLFFIKSLGMAILSPLPWIHIPSNTEPQDAISAVAINKKEDMLKSEVNFFLKEPSLGLCAEC